MEETGGGAAVIIQVVMPDTKGTVVFAEKSDARVLGVHALEGLGLQLDPTANKLKKVRVVLSV